MKKEIKFFLLGMASVIVTLAIIWLGMILITKISDNRKKTINTSNNKVENNYGYEKLKGKIICDVLDNIKTLGYDYFITNNNELYLLNQNQKFSNNLHCKKVENKKIKKIISNSFVDEENNIFNFDDDYNLKEDTYSNIDHIINIDDIIIATSSRENIETKKEYFYALKNDGKIYKMNLSFSYNDYTGKKKYKLANEEIYKTFENEKVLDFRGYIIDDGILNIDYLKTDKSYYLRKNINKKECNKYADIKCEYELLKDEFLTANYDNVAIVSYSMIMKNGDIYNNNDLY